MNKNTPPGADITRLEAIALALPESYRIDICAWGDHPTFRVRKKIFLFTNAETTYITVKLTKEEAAALIATNPVTCPASYGLGRYGWVTTNLVATSLAPDWIEIAELVESSYRLIAPKKLVKNISE